MERVYIVTGAYGHLGNTIVKQLVMQGEKVRCFDLARADAPALQGLAVEIVHGDTRDLRTLDALFACLDEYEIIVIHTAAIISIAHAYNRRMHDVNVDGTKNLLDKSKQYGVKRFLYVSSVHAITELPHGEVIREINAFDPALIVGAYAKTKAEATQLVLDRGKDGLDVVVVHPSGIIGPNDYGEGHLTMLVAHYLNGRLSTVVRGGYDFVDVRDVAAGTIAAVDRGRSGETYILTNVYATIVDFLDLVGRISGKHRRVRLVPLFLAKWIAPIAERIYKLRKQTPMFTTYSLYTLESNGNFSHEKASVELGYTPRPIEETIADTIEFLKEHGRLA